VRISGWVVAIVLTTAVIVGVVLFLTDGRNPFAPVGAPEGTAPYPIPDAVTPATIEYVHDGDTLFLTDGTKVRLLGIDTPEIGENRECYGDEATALLRSLLPEGAPVRVLSDVQPLDQYGRSLLFIYTDGGELVNLAMIEQGAAEAVVLEPNLLFADELEAAEDAAQSAGTGMWGAC
jgi:micrococcal nuclease